MRRSSSTASGWTPPRERSSSPAQASSGRRSPRRPETTIVAIGGTPGEAYEPDGWELWAPLRPLYEQGEYAAAAERGRALVEAHPEYTTLFYNLACCESLAGQTTEALEDLRRSIEMSERSRAYAKGDSDFDPIRDEPAFKELVG